MNSLIAFLFSSLVISPITASILASHGGNETDYQALMHFKSMITSDSLSSWNSSFHFCDWRGVRCGKRHKRLIGLRLVSQGLEGSLSPHIGNLSFLRFLYLFNNSFQGTIPHELGRLSRLRALDLGSNEFNGVIPTNLSRCSNLEGLSLLGNKLVGIIPKEISFLQKLTYFIVEGNKLTGGIPSVLGNITLMQVFSVADNPLGGSIPETLGNWKSLTGFYLGGCNLFGTIPLSIYNLSLLTNFSLPVNELTGSLPSTIGTMLPHLQRLQLHNNQLTGVLPISISNCSKLGILELNDNSFSGKLRIDFSKLKNIYQVSLFNNIYEADYDMKFIDSLKNCSKLKNLLLSDCNFQGVLPKSIGNLSEKLSFLNLEGNQFYGNLPSSISNLVGLTELGLTQNRFTGKIPSIIDKLQKLEVVYLQENRFSGPIPESIGNLSLLAILDLSSNRLQWHIPSSLGNCHHLSELYLEDNKLTDNIPKQLLQLSSLTIALNLSQNDLSGSLPTEVGELKMLSYLDLSRNNLSGNIPSSLDGCTSLLLLSLKGNLFQGGIPLSLSSMRGLQTLDLSHNNLSGKIPRFLERLPLEHLDLSFNDFEGEVSVQGVFANASAFSFLGNNRLCGGLAELRLPKCKETGKHKIMSPLFVISIMIVSTIFIVLCIVYAWCKKSKGQPSQSSSNIQFMKVSYGQLLKATNGFSEENLIREGGSISVYKGVLDDHDDRLVAIKVVNLQNRGANESFIAECEAWRNIRHRNLLKIITSCSSVDYQGNDILLDDDMVAHVGDFGLARFLGINLIQNSTSGIRGTIGYAPPEYGVGSEMTSSGDVYNFGVLLLEVMTGKRPTDNIFNEGLNLHKFACVALRHHVTEVIDDGLLNFLQEDATPTRYTSANTQKIEECLFLTLKIGVSCSVDSPPHRMNIENVVHELQQVRDTLQNI